MSHKTDEKMLAEQQKFGKASHELYSFLIEWKKVNKLSDKEAAKVLVEAAGKLL
ncbi:hypothetical protein [Undibacterium oligocarboniphilum]|uniref:Uncharacterized protein n=1 Tax=Undibacterium oligocarboniphilum TaxID=666702 RepID=A0A850QIN9_9BURK|nr:hypothetical protein [Undibacterium oligocarboniphilum]MBC3871457.1 hypothetical protein [Undibacterium oligocarboniphilum]NVO78967.1 hypothetical protein [Undibacterium oligocarboniphilum]